MRSLALVCLLIPTLSHAATWEDFQEAFPAFPCNDGWSACVSGDGERITPDLAVRDGLRRKSADRLDWNDMDATGTFDPFGTLSPYEPFVAPEVEIEEVAEVQVEVEVEREPVTEVATTTADKRVQPDAADPDEPVQPNVVEPVTPGETEAERTARLAQEQADKQRLADEEASRKVALERQQGGTPNVDCSDLVRLEPMAMMGKLTDDHVGCLEARMAVAETQTEKSKISLVLIKTKKVGSKPWEQAMRRHLSDINQSDPDIAYIFASHLSKKGPTRAEEALRWSRVALENKTRWSGKTFVDRVYGLHKIQSRAAYELWKDANTEFTETNSADAEARMKRWEGETKTHAREWYDYANEAGRDTTKALQMCMSAAGTEDYCTGK